MLMKRFQQENIIREIAKEIALTDTAQIFLVRLAPASLINIKIHRIRFETKCLCLMELFINPRLNDVLRIVITAKYFRNRFQFLL